MGLGFRSLNLCVPSSRAAGHNWQFYLRTREQRHLLALGDTNTNVTAGLGHS